MIKIIHRLEWFVGLALFQVLILNQMHINGYATPFLFIYFILKYNSAVGKNELMLWSFALGLLVDMFSDTPGMNAAAATLLAFLRTPILQLVTLRDRSEAYRPGIRALGLSAYFRYVLLCSTLFCISVLAIDAFSFFNFPMLLLKMISSIFATIICIFCTELIERDNK